ncbi:MAG: hypothetical protein ABIH23_32575 [bacterium]
MASTVSSLPIIGTLTTPAALSVVIGAGVGAVISPAAVKLARNWGLPLPTAIPDHVYNILMGGLLGMGFGLIGKYTKVGFIKNMATFMVFGPAVIAVADLFNSYVLPMIPGFQGYRGYGDYMAIPYRGYGDYMALPYRGYGDQRMIEAGQLGNQYQIEAGQLGNVYYDESGAY